MPAICWDCGEPGHISGDCPNKGFTASADGKPLWCGICDERTRLIGLDVVTRCPQCHPLARHSLKQHRKCPRCHMTVHQWDEEQCGSHSAPAAADKRPDSEHIRETTGTTRGVLEDIRLEYRRGQGMAS